MHEHHHQSGGGVIPGMLLITIATVSGTNPGVGSQSEHSNQIRQTDRVPRTCAAIGTARWRRSRAFRVPVIGLYTRDLSRSCALTWIKASRDRVRVFSSRKRHSVVCSQPIPAIDRRGPIQRRSGTMYSFDHQSARLIELLCERAAQGGGPRPTVAGLVGSVLASVTLPTGSLRRGSIAGWLATARRACTKKQHKSGGVATACRRDLRVSDLKSRNGGEGLDPPPQPSNPLKSLKHRQKSVPMGAKWRSSAANYQRKITSANGRCRIKARIFGAGQTRRVRAIILSGGL